MLYRAIKQLDSKGLLGDEAVLRATAHGANRALRILAELIDVTRERAPTDQGALVRMVKGLLVQVRFYAERKHLLAPTSGWFMPEPVFPRWVETDYSEVSIALQTSTPLQHREEPAADWLERRSAELASAALKACVDANNREAALQITHEVALTARTLASCGRLDDSIAFSEIVRDGCWAVESENAAAAAVAAEPPLVLSYLLLGWRDAISSWPEEVRAAVGATDWDRSDTAMLRIRGSARVWTAAQRLLREVRAEHEIAGRRATPDWYLRFALAGECILSLREFAERLPKLLDDFADPPLAQSSSLVKAMAGAQALQALAKAQLVVETIPQALKGLECLRLGHDPQPTEEIEGLGERIQACRPPVLKRIAEAVTDLRPERSQSTPDLFGQALFTLVNHTEQAIASGDVGLVRSLFPKILSATLIFEEHILSTYKPPTYQYNSAIVDPMIDLLQLSGEALIYAVLRGDRSDDLVCEAWVRYVKSFPQPEDAAKRVLDMLDLADGTFPFGSSPRRTTWEMRLAKDIVKAGYAQPEYIPFDNQPAWTAPLLVKMLSVSTSMPSLSIKPRAVFAAEVIAPLSGESEETLRKRPGIQRYYEGRDFHGASDVPDEAANDDSEGHKDGLTGD